MSQKHPLIISDSGNRSFKVKQLVETARPGVIEVLVGYRTRQDLETVPAEEGATLGAGHLVATVDLL